jgi:hypothetical protein
VFEVWQNCLKTDRDELFFDLDRDVLEQRIQTFYSPTCGAEFKETYRISASSSYDIESRRDATRYSPTKIVKCLHRPFDAPWLYYDPKLTSRPAWKVMSHMLRGSNLALISCRQQSQQGVWRLVGVTNGIAEGTAISNKTKEALNFFFPLYLYSGDGPQRDLVPTAARRPNLSPAFVLRLSEALGLGQNGTASLPIGLTPEDIFHYIYAVFHSPGYRSRYAEFLKIDFPRLPLTASLELFRALAELGGELVALHLLESPTLEKPRTEFVTPSAQPSPKGRGSGGPLVEKVGWTKDGGGTVWIDAAGSRSAIRPGTSGFRPVPEDVWNFHIGGYQVCEKWLKDRRGRALSKDDIAHYHKIVIALTETIHLMAEIDRTIDTHGGWPGAFQTT